MALALSIACVLTAGLCFYAAAWTLGLSVGAPALGLASHPRLPAIFTLTAGLYLVQLTVLVLGHWPPIWLIALSFAAFGAGVVELKRYRATLAAGALGAQLPQELTQTDELSLRAPQVVTLSIPVGDSLIELELNQN